MYQVVTVAFAYGARWFPENRSRIFKLLLHLKMLGVFERIRGEGRTRWEMGIIAD